MCCFFSIFFQVFFSYMNFYSFYICHRFTPHFLPYLVLSSLHPLSVILIFRHASFVPIFILCLSLALSLLPLASNWPTLYWLQPKMMSLIILVEIMWLSVCLCACACALACNRMCECVCVLYLANKLLDLYEGGESACTGMYEQCNCWKDAE